ncbi:MAG: hypothetical protein JSS34_06980 [Proteobacteria bacterium]|nr:hypothetical protein [Pseudomonadota bacterium]
MSVFSTKYFVRSHILVAMLGSLSLFSLESNGMGYGTEDTDLYSAQFLSSPSRGTINSDLDQKVIDTIRSLPDDPNKILPETVEFFEGMIPHQQHLSAMSWLTSVNVLLEGGDEKQKAQSYRTLLETMERNIYKRQMQYNLSGRLREKSELFPEYKQRVQNVLKTLFDNPELSMYERTSLACHFYDQEEDGQKYSSFLVEAAKNSHSSESSRLEIIGKVIRKEGLSPERQNVVMFIVSDILSDSWRSHQCRSTLENTFKDMPNAKEFIADIFMGIAENSVPDLFSRENSKASLSPNLLRVKAALNVFKSQDMEQRKRALSVLQPFLENPTFLSFQERLETLKTMAYQSSEEMPLVFVYDALSSILLDPNSTLSIDSELDIASILSWSREKKHKEICASFFLARSRRLGVPQNEALAALYYVVNSQNKDLAHEAFLELEKISNTLQPDAKERVGILNKIISSCKNELQERAGAALLSLAETQENSLRRSFLQTVASHGTSDHKKIACDHLLGLSEKDKRDVKEYLKTLEIVISYGNDDQKKKACNEICTVLETASLDLNTRLSGLKLIAYRKALDEDKRAVSALANLAVTSSEFTSLEERIDCLNDILSCRFNDYGENVCALLLTLLGANYQTMTLETFESVKEKINWRGTPTQKAEMASIQLSKMESAEGSSFTERVKNLFSILNLGDEKSGDKAFKQLMELLRSPERSYQECTEIFNYFHWNSSEDQEESLYDSLLFVFQTSQLLTNEDRIDLAQKILWSKKQDQRKMARNFLISVLQTSNFPFERCLDIAYILESHREENESMTGNQVDPEDQIQSEQVCHILYSFYEKAENAHRLSIATFIMKYGTNSQKEALYPLLVSLTKDPTLSQEAQEKISHMIGSLGTLQQREEFLLDRFGSPNVPFELWKKEYESFWRDYKFDPLAEPYEEIVPQETMREALLKIIEDPASPLSIEYRKSAAFMLTSLHSNFVRSHNNSARAYAVLWSIFETSNDSLDERKDFCEDIVSSWNSKETDKVKAAEHLITFLQEDVKLDLSKRIKIARLLVEKLGNYERSEKLKEFYERAGDFLLSLMRRTDIDFARRKEIASFLLGNHFDRGATAKQKHEVSAFLLPLIREDSSPLSLDDRRFFSSRILITGNSQQKEQACTYLLSLIEDSQSALSDANRRSLAEEINKHGTEDQKRRAGALLLEKTHPNDIHTHFMNLRQVLEHGTPETKENAVEKLFSFAQDPQNSLENQGTALRIVAECRLEKHRERACDALKVLSEKEGIHPQKRLSLLKTISKYGSLQQKEAACSLLLELSAQPLENSSLLSSRLELIRDICWYGPTEAHKEKAFAVWLALLKDPSIWPSFKERVDSMTHFSQNVNKAELQEDVNSLLLAQVIDPLLWGANVKDRLSAIERVLYTGTTAQKEAAHSILLSIAQSTDLPFKVRIKQADRVLWKGTETQKQTAFDILETLSHHSDISQKDLLNIAESLIGDQSSSRNHVTPHRQAVRASALLLSILEDKGSTFSQRERLDFANKVISLGSPEQKKAGIHHVFSIVEDFREESALCAQIDPLTAMLVQGDPEAQKRASDLLISLLENPALSPDNCVELANRVSWSSQKRHYEHFEQGVKLIHRILDSVQNFDNSLSFEKRFSIAEQIAERNYSGSSSHHLTAEQLAGYDALLTIMERPGAPLEKRKEISRRMQSFCNGISPSARSEMQGNRAWRILWGVLKDPQISREDFNHTALFLSGYSYGKEMPAGMGEILLPLMSDPDILKGSTDHHWGHQDKKSKEERERERLLSSHREVALFLLQYGETEDQKERAGDFLNTSLLNDEGEVSDAVFSYHNGLRDIAFRVLLHGTPTQKERVGTYLLSLIGNDHLSLKKRIDTAVILMNDCVPQQRETVRGVLQTILTPEMITHIREFIQRWHNDGIVIGNMRIRQEPLSRITKELLVSTLLSYVEDNTTLSVEKRSEVLQMALHSGLITRDQLILTRLLLADVPTENRTLLQGILGIYWTDLMAVVPADSGIQPMIVTLGRQPSTEWQQTIEQTIARYRPQEVRQPAAARHAPPRSTYRPAFDQRYEVHQFSAVSASHVEGSMTQHEAAMNIIEEDLSTKEASPVPVMGFVRAFKEIHNWIKTNYPPSRHASALRSIQAGMDMPGAKECVSKIVTWLMKFHLEKIDVWMRGFVGESLSAYEAADSCPHGVDERAITGLRGDIDERINLIFEGATKMQSAKAFIASLDFKNPTNKAWLVQKFIELGVRAQTPEVEAARLFRDFGRSIIMGKGLAKTHVSEAQTERFYLDQVDVFAQMMEDYYEDEFKGPILRALEVRALAAATATNSAMAEASSGGLSSSENVRAEESPEKNK